MTRKRRNNVSKNFISFVNNMPNNNKSLTDAQRDKLVRYFIDGYTRFDDLICMSVHYYLKPKTYKKGEMLLDLIIENFEYLKESNQYLTFKETKRDKQTDCVVISYNNFFLRHLDCNDYHVIELMRTPLYEKFNFILYENGITLPYRFSPQSLKAFMEF